MNRSILGGVKTKGIYCIDTAFLSLSRALHDKHELHLHFQLALCLKAGMHSDFIYVLFIRNQLLFYREQGNDTFTHSLI